MIPGCTTALLIRAPPTLPFLHQAVYACRMKIGSSYNWWMFGVALLVGMGGILYGYDIGVISGAMLFFRKSIPMTDTEAGVIVGAVLAGGLLGTLITGPLADKFGRRIMIAAASLIFIIGVLCILYAHTFMTMLLARLLLGVGVGVVSVAVPLYVTEMVPKEDRGKYVTFFQLFLTFGIVLAYAVDLLLTPSGNWRAMFAVVFFPAFILLIGVVRLPESPRWLISQGKLAKARQILLRTRSKTRAERDLHVIYENIKLTDGTWAELFSPKLFFPLFIGISIAILNQWTGINCFLQYAPDILHRAGLGSDFASMLGSLGIGVINFLCTFIALFLIDRVGRKPLLLTGVMGIFIVECYLAIVNGLHLTPYRQGLLSLYGLFGFIIFFAIGPGVVVWLAISELLPTRVRGKAMALCLFFSSLSGTLMASLFLDLRDYLGMSGTYALCAFFTLIYCFIAVYWLPETRARSLEDIQRYFRNMSNAPEATPPADSFTVVE